MRERRTLEEILTDEILFLALLDRVDELGYIGDRIKVQKLTFLCTHPMFIQKAKGFNFTFYRWEWGPMANGVYQAWENLCQTAHLDEQEHFVMTDSGRTLAREFRHDVLEREENRLFWNIVDGVCGQYAKKAGSTIRKDVYRMEVVPIGYTSPMSIKSVPLTVHLTQALDEDEAEHTIAIDQGWLETLAIMLRPENKASIEKAVRDFKQGRVLTHEEVWGGV